MAKTSKKDEAAVQPIIVKKIKKSAEGHHGGAWKVAYADFVTAMMAFFLLLWLLNVASEDQLEIISSSFEPTHIKNFRYWQPARAGLNAGPSPFSTQRAPLVYGMLQTRGAGFPNHLNGAFYRGPGEISENRKFPGILGNNNLLIKKQSCPL